MAIVYDGPVPLDALTTFVRRVPIPSSNLLSQLFPVREFDSNTVDFAELTMTNRAARYRAWDGQIHVTERDSGASARVKLLPMSDSLNEGEYERVALAIAQYGGSNEQMIANAAYNDVEILGRNVHNRREMALGDVVHDAKLTIDEGGYQGVADFAMPANQVHIPAVPWSDLVNAKPLTDLAAWNQTRIANGNSPAGTLLMSQLTRTLLQRNKEVIDAVHGATAGRTRVSLAELTELLVSEGLPTVVTYDSSFDIDGVVTRTLPVNHVALLPADISTLGFWAWGVTATARELMESSAVDFSYADGPGIVAVIEKVGPPYRKFTFIDACGMPILADARQLSTATVA